MKKIPINRAALLCLCMIICTALLVKCIDHDVKNVAKADAAKDSTGFILYAGSATCAKCHKDIYDSAIHTQHYLTTRPASAEYIKGSFEQGKNFYAYAPNIVVAMEKSDSGFFEVGYFNGIAGISKRIDIVVGSGAKGQTYITRYKNKLYQLPVSYFTAANDWANSPEYPTHPVIFNRPITSRCLECHTTFVEKIPTPDHSQEEFSQNIIYGIDCEKCHGPGAKHVAYQTQNPKDAIARYIVNPAKFSRQQSLDLCGLCHGGKLDKTKPSFTFISGDKLSDYFQKSTLRVDSADIDVHGNQLGLLSISKCFKNSSTMTCITCHSPHDNERGKIELFSQRCISCHGNQKNHSYKMTAEIGSSIKENCIDCHMPLRPSKTITELLPGKTRPTAALIRSHHIAIYPEDTKKILAIFKLNKYDGHKHEALK